MFESSQPSPSSRPSSVNNNVAKPWLAIESNYNFPNLAGLSRYLANSRDRCNPGELQLTYRDDRRVPLVVVIEKGSISCKISRIKKKSSNRKSNRLSRDIVSSPIQSSNYASSYIRFVSCNDRFTRYPAFRDVENALWKEIRKDGYLVARGRVNLSNTWGSEYIAITIK